MGDKPVSLTNLSTILSGWTVLVIDDEPDNVDVARRLLKRAGATVYVAENGRMALDTLNRIQPDFILSDISMPEMDGWTLISIIQREGRFAKIPMIALTSYAMNGDRERAFAAGFVNYITKPLDVKKFIIDLVAILVDIPEITKRLNSGPILENE